MNECMGKIFIKFYSVIENACVFVSQTGTDHPSTLATPCLYWHYHTCSS